MKVILQKPVVCFKFDIYGFLFLFFYFLNSALIIDSHILYLFFVAEICIQSIFKNKYKKILRIKFFYLPIFNKAFLKFNICKESTIRKSYECSFLYDIQVKTSYVHFTARFIICLKIDCFPCTIIFCF